MVGSKSLVRLALSLLLLHSTLPSSADTRPCDRELRKTLESIQAYRRMHAGQYPATLVDLRLQDFLPPDGAVCPETSSESLGGNAAHLANTSRGGNADPGNLYEYELSSRVAVSRDHLPPGYPDSTRSDIKLAILRRPYSEQLPILRCSAHRATAPEELAGRDDVRRNITVNGSIYWSERYWELLWVDDVPLCARDANMLCGLRGPPFYDDCPPTAANALDLRAWSCGFPDLPWWWDNPMFKGLGTWHSAPDLRSFSANRTDHLLPCHGDDWWVNGLVQLQGCPDAERANRYAAYRLQVFARKKTALPVHRRISGAAWLQGTVWEASAGEPVARLVWHYADGTQSESEISYGRDTARFWATPAQRLREIALPEPIWETQEPSGDFGYERQIRLYRQEWANPKPAIEVTALDFIADPNCPAAPFIIAINVMP